MNDIITKKLRNKYIKFDNVFKFVLRIFKIAIGILIFASLLSTSQAHCNPTDPTPYCTYSFNTTDNAMQITVDENVQDSPYNSTWTYGSNHSIGVPFNQSISDKSQYVFTSWDFTPWVGNSVSISEPSFPIVSELDTSGTYIANYKKQYYLTINTDPSNINTIAGSGWYDSGYTTTLTAPINAGSYTFLVWNVDGNNVSGNPISILMDTEHTATSVFVQTPYTISVSTDPPGLIQPSGGRSYFYGDTATVVAQNVKGYKFQKWTENGSPVNISMTYSFSVKSDRDLVAEYVKTPYTVMVSTVPQGLIPNPLIENKNSNEFFLGDNITVTAQKVTDYIFRKWVENGEFVSSENPYSFILAGDRNLMAVYSKESIPNITLIPNSGESGTEVTIIGNGFDIFEESFPKVYIYFDNIPIKNDVILEKDDSGTIGKFTITTKVPLNLKSGTYTILVQGPKNSVSVPFTVKSPFHTGYLIGSAIAFVGIIGGVILIIKHRLLQKAKKIIKEGQEFIHSEQRIHVEYENFKMQHYDMSNITWKVEGGIKKI